MKKFFFGFIYSIPIGIIARIIGYYADDKFGIPHDSWKSLGIFVLVFMVLINLGRTVEWYRVRESGEVFP